MPKICPPGETKLLIRSVMAFGCAALLLGCNADPHPSALDNANRSPIASSVRSLMAQADESSQQQGKLLARQLEGGSEFRLSSRGEAWIAQHPIHGWEAAIAPSGVRLSGPNNEWQVSFSSVSSGCSDRVIEQPQGKLKARENRAELQRGSVREWYVHGPAGVEQGFTVLSRPPCKGLHFELSITGDLTPRLERRQNAPLVSLRSSDGKERASYSGLFALDKNGTTLPSKMTLTGDRVRIDVDDTGAEYPVVVDPIIAVAKAEIIPYQFNGSSWVSDAQAGANFGFSAAIAGSYAAGGAPSRSGTLTGSGAVYVYEGNFATGSYVPVAKLTAPTEVKNNQFGYSVSISNDLLVVGEPANGGAGATGPGKVYLYQRSAGPPVAWNLIKTFTPADCGDMVTAVGTMFGSSVDIYNRTIVIGAMGESVGGKAIGRAFVLDDTSGDGNFLCTIMDERSVAGINLVPAAGDQYGKSVAVYGDLLLVGADSAKAGSPSALNQGGIADVWNSSTASGDKTFSYNTTLTGNDAFGSPQFGFAVDITPKYALIGAPFSSSLASNAGATYLYTWAGSPPALVTPATHKISKGLANDKSGTSVAISDIVDAALIGARFATSPAGTANAGAAYVFDQSKDDPNTEGLDNWGFSYSAGAAAASTFSEAANDAFGQSVGVTGQVGIVGAPGRKLGTGANEGAIYLYYIGHGNGDACTSDTECGSGFCVDGVCCDQSCGGNNTTDCQACSMLLGASANGTCTILAAPTACGGNPALCEATGTCNGTSTSCPAGLACVAPLVCDGAGNCKKPNGQSCSAGTECVSSNCVDGTCCSTASCPLCQSCAVGPNGTCGNIANGSPDDTAPTLCQPPNNACDGNGTCRKQNGQSCSAGAECQSNNCVDGTCCSTAACPLCQSCAVGPAGTCGNIANDSPDNTAPTLCQTPNFCDGSGTCKKANGQSCSAGAECQSNNCVDGTCCSTAACPLCQSCAVGPAGTCGNIANGSPDNTAPTLCQAPNNSCDGSGNCKKQNGQSCSAATECLSGFCVDGVCCNSACGGGSLTDCQACSTARGAAVNGTCGNASATTQCGVGDDATCIAGYFCTGSSPSCPPTPTAAGPTVVCSTTADASRCIAGYSCDGTTTGSCPNTRPIPAGSSVQCATASAATCLADSFCDGQTAGSCPHTPADNTVICSNVADLANCRSGYRCDGSTVDSCPTSNPIPASDLVQCRAKANECDAAEYCSGLTVGCPSDGNLPNNQSCSMGSCQAGTCRPESDLSLTITSIALPGYGQLPVQFTGQVTNSGPATAQNVSVHFTVPANSTLQRVGGTGWTCQVSGSDVDCTAGDVVPGAPPPVIMVVMPNSGQTSATLNASVATVTADPNLSNNSASNTSTIPPITGSDLAVTISRSPSNPNPGQETTYTVQLTNKGPAGVASPTVTFAIPAGVTVTQPPQGSGWTCSQSALIVTCNRPDGPVGDAPPITFKVVIPTIPDPSQPDPEISVAATAAQNRDPNPANNAATSPILPATPTGSDLSVTLSRSPDQPKPNDEVTYTLQARNNGPDAVGTVTVTLELPPDAQIIEAPHGNGWQCTAAGTVFLCTRPSLDSGDAPPITAKVRLPSGTDNPLQPDIGWGATTIQAADNNDPKTENNLFILLGKFKLSGGGFGCSCEAAGTPHSNGPVAGFLMLAAIALFRRRRFAHQ